jgi:superfamily II DNA or RNA helicase
MSLIRFPDPKALAPFGVRVYSSCIETQFMNLRPHQQRAVDIMQLHLKGQCIMPTGAGKTITMIRDAMIQFQQNDANANAN